MWPNRSRKAARERYNRLSRWYALLAGSVERKYHNQGLEKSSGLTRGKDFRLGKLPLDGSMAKA